MFIRRFSCQRKCLSQVVKHIEDNVLSSNKIHSDIYKRQEYIQKQLNDVYFDIDYIDKRIESLESSIKRLCIRLESLEMKQE